MLNIGGLFEVFLLVWLFEIITIINPVWVWGQGSFLLVKIRQLLYPRKKDWEPKHNTTFLAAILNETVNSDYTWFGNTLI